MEIWKKRGDNMIKLIDKNIDYHFYCIPYGTVEPKEVIVQWIFKDEKSGKKYMVFFSNDNNYKYFVREYIGDIEDENYFKVNDTKTIYQICKILDIKEYR